MSCISGRGPLKMKSNSSRTFKTTVDPSGFKSLSWSCHDLKIFLHTQFRNKNLMLGFQIILKAFISAPISMKADLDKHTNQINFPGFRIPFGSNAFLIDCMSDNSVGLLTWLKRSRFIRPMPCSALMDPPKSKTIL